MAPSVLAKPATERFVRHRGPVTCVAPVPNTRKAVSSGYDGSVGLFDLATGEAELLGYHRHLVNRVTVDAAGARAASISSDYLVYIWDLQTRKVSQVLRGHSDDVEDFAFLDESTGASVGRDWRILVWDLATGAIVRELEGPEKDVLSVAYFGGRLYTCGDDKTLRAWDAATGRLLASWGPFDVETDTCALDPIHRRVALGCDDGVIRLFGLEDDSRAEVKAHTSGIKKVAVCPVTGDVLSAAYDQRIRIWDARDLRPKVELEKRRSTWERSLNWWPDGSSVVAGTFDGTAVEWDARTGRLLGEVGDPGEGNACFNEVTATADGRLALVSDDGFVRLARIAPGEARWLARVAPRSGRVLMNAVTCDPDYRLVACGAHDHKLHLFEWSGDALHGEVEVALGQGPINSIRIARHAGFEGQSFAACYSGAVCRVTREGRVAAVLPIHDGAVKALRLHPTAPLGVSCSADGGLVSWDFSGKVVQRFAGHTSIVDDVDLAPGSTAIASSGRDFILKVYGLHDGKLRHSLRLGRRSPKCICFVADDLVLVGNYWGELLIADLARERVTRRTIARNGISSLARCGANVVATSYDGGVYLVRPTDGEVLQTLRAMTQRLREDADG